MSLMQNLRGKNAFGHQRWLDFENADKGLRTYIIIPILHKKVREVYMRESNAPEMSIMSR